jgi:hypothetical protein
VAHAVVTLQTMPGEIQCVCNMILHINLPDVVLPVNESFVFEVTASANRQRYKPLQLGYPYLPTRPGHSRVSAPMDAAGQEDDQSLRFICDVVSNFEEPAKKQEPFPSCWAALVAIVKLALPVAGSSPAGTILPFISLVFVGHLSEQGAGSPEIAASGLAAMIANGAWVVLLLGALRG